jgi:hypothetical protein
MLALGKRAAVSSGSTGCLYGLDVAQGSEFIFQASSAPGDIRIFVAGSGGKPRVELSLQLRTLGPGCVFEGVLVIGVGDPVEKGFLPRLKIVGKCVPFIACADLDPLNRVCERIDVLVGFDGWPQAHTVQFEV